MKEPIISIIIPVYNVEKYLNRCINSILKQSFKDYEVILVDDGSIDHSGKICDYFACKYNNFSVIHKKNAGLGYARNSGLEVAKGKYIVFVDSDDYLKPDMLEVMYNQMIQNNADTCIGGYCRVNQSEIVEFPNPLKGRVFYQDKILDELLVKMTGKLPEGTDYIEMSVWSVIFSASIIRKHHLRFPSERELISEDIIFDLKYFNHSKCVFISDVCGYYYCENEGSLTTSYRNNRFELHKTLYYRLKKDLDHLLLYEKCKVRIQNNFISNVRHCIKIEVKFMEQNGRQKCKNNIRKMCTDPLVQQVLSEFPNKRASLKPRLLNFLIRRKFICFIYIAVRATLKE